MFTWVPYTFVRFFFFFVMGILLGIFFPGLVSGALAIITVSVLSGLYFLLVFMKHSFRFVNAGVIGLAFLILAGYSLVFLRTESNEPNHIINESQAIRYYKVNIVSYPEEKKGSWKQIGEVMAIKTDAELQQGSGKVLLYFDKKDFQEPFPYGTNLLIKGSPQVISPPANPHEFDYKKFLSFRNIFHQHFVKSEDAIFIEHAPQSKILELTFAARTGSLGIIKKNVVGEREQAIASALVLGVTDNLDDDLLRAYASSGAIHVLAVSGLHIGILYAVIMFLFRPLRKYTNGKWAMAFVSIGCLWGYAFITGLSPSVLRAVTMFTFVVLAETLRKRSDIYNTLALSAFCLLLYDPYLIMSVGFQLSYLAVLGIVYLYPRFIFLWTPPAILIPVWKITCVSMAAQLATFPLGLLYFHQFPVYFLVSNLFVIPLSFIVLVLGLGVLGLSLFAALAQGAGILLTYVIKFMNAAVLLTESLPGSLIKGIHLNSVQYWLLCSLMVTFVLLFQLRKLAFLYIGLGLALCNSVIQWTHWTQRQHHELIVYNVRGHFALDIFERSTVYHLTDSVLLNNPDLSAFQINGNRIAKNVYSIQTGEHFPFVRNLVGCRLIQLKNMLLLQITDKKFAFSDKLPVEYVIISNNAVKNLDDINEKVDCRQIIIDSSNSWSVAERLSRQAREVKKSFHSVLHEGAFVKEL